MTDQAGAEQKVKEEGGFGETVKVVIQALLIALVIRTVLFQPFNIPSGSLIPTLLIGDYLFVSKYSYGYSRFSLPQLPDSVAWIVPKSLELPKGRLWSSEPKRGDVAVFKLPRDGSTDYIKRVIGLPGDRVQLVNGRVIINGEMVPREDAPRYTTNDVYGRKTEVATYRETLPGGSKHTIIEIEGDRGFNDNTPAFTVPPGHYFMMGDNRDNSTDSRVPADREGVGMVPLENFVGRAEIIFFSIDGDVASIWEVWKWPFAIRWSRLLQPVR
jgi:signal peptidase I